MVIGVEPSQIACDKDHKVVIHPFSKATSSDMMDFVKPLIKRKPDTFILHIGANDITNKIDTINNLKEIRKLFRKDLPDCDFVLSECTMRNDRKGINNKVNSLNDEINLLSTELNIQVIKHNDRSHKHLGKGKLHLNERGKSLFALDFRDYLENALDIIIPPWM